MTSKTTAQLPTQRILQAVADPGSILPRGADNRGEPYGEPIPEWSARAVERVIRGWLSAEPWQEPGDLVDVEAPDVDKLVGGNWPLHGPYGADFTVAAAGAMSALTRYLNYCTGQGAKDALPFPATASSLVGNLSAMAGGLDQTFSQLLAYLAPLPGNSRLYDHVKRDDPWAAGERVKEAILAVTAARLAAIGLFEALQDAQSALARLGVREPEPECTCVYSCADDPATACSLSGRWHVHPDEGSGTFGPCPEHPDAPGDH